MKALIERHGCGEGSAPTHPRCVHTRHSRVLLMVFPGAKYIFPEAQENPMEKLNFLVEIFCPENYATLRSDPVCELSQLNILAGLVHKRDPIEGSHNFPDKSSRRKNQVFASGFF